MMIVIPYFVKLSKKLSNPGHFFGNSDAGITITEIRIPTNIIFAFIIIYNK